MAHRRLIRLGAGRLFRPELRSGKDGAQQSGGKTFAFAHWNMGSHDCIFFCVAGKYLFYIFLPDAEIAELGKRYLKYR
jgi:hypothetical protein